MRRWRWAFLMYWMFSLAGSGLQARFTGDDLTNLHVHLARSFGQLALSNAMFWSTEYRPMGGLFYAGIYRLFGFRPLPFRIGCFALIVVNLVLLYRVCAKLGGSREAGFLAALLDGYHASFVDLYRSTGTVYELLCFALYRRLRSIHRNQRRKANAGSVGVDGDINALHRGAQLERTGGDFTPCAWLLRTHLAPASLRMGSYSPMDRC